MKLVYVAGPYRAVSEWEVTQNIRRAEEMALRVWQAGAACICPHKNTAMFGGAADDKVWLEGGLIMLGKCDAVMLVNGWEKSEGTLEEMSYARDKRIPIFERFEDLVQWLVCGTSDG